MRSTHNQLFKKIPGEDVALGLLKLFGINGFDDKRCFSRKDLDKLGTVGKVQEMIPELRQCYLNCKAKAYLNELTPKSVITILRQVLKANGYNIVSREKYIKGEKFLIYNIVSRSACEYKPVILNFD